jgi:hypothetical protein
METTVSPGLTQHFLFYYFISHCLRVIIFSCVVRKISTITGANMALHFFVPLFLLCICITLFLLNIKFSDLFVVDKILGQGYVDVFMLSVLIAMEL